jgi:hypothetical protein
MKSDKKFLIGLRLYIGIFLYSITVGYLYGNYKNYNMVDCMMISICMGLLMPFFLPIHYILHKYVEDEKLESLFIQETLKAPLIVFKYLCSGNKYLKPVRA